MPAVTVELTARQDTVGQPIIWRLGRLFNVVTNIRRARVSDDYGHVSLLIEGSVPEVDQALNYLRAMGLVPGETGISLPTGTLPEDTVAQPNTIYVRLTTVNDAQAHAPILYRIGKDFNVVVNLAQAAFDQEDAGYIEVTLSGPLAEVQRSIAYLHTTGIHVNPRQRSVTDYSNL